jgi:hypothetical protein
MTKWLSLVVGAAMLLAWAFGSPGHAEENLPNVKRCL